LEDLAGQLTHHGFQYSKIEFKNSFRPCAVLHRAGSEGSPIKHPSCEAAFLLQEGSKARRKGVVADILRALEYGGAITYLDINAVQKIFRSLSCPNLQTLCRIDSPEFVAGVGEIPQVKISSNAC
jgi:hypothetical protein